MFTDLVRLYSHKVTKLCFSKVHFFFLENKERVKQPRVGGGAGGRVLLGGGGVAERWSDKHVTQNGSNQGPLLQSCTSQPGRVVQRRTTLDKTHVHSQFSTSSYFFVSGAPATLTHSQTCVHWDLFSRCAPRPRSPQLITLAQSFITTATCKIRIPPPVGKRVQTRCQAHSAPTCIAWATYPPFIIFSERLPSSDKGQIHIFTTLV